MTDERDIDLIKGDIEVTRRRIAGEIEAIGERLTPEHAKEVAKEKIVEAKDRAIENVKSSARRIAGVASAAPGEIGHAIRENPIPTIMVCAGTGWLLYSAFSRMRQRQTELPWESTGYSDLEEPGRMARAKERISSAASAAKERVSSAADSARTRARDTALMTKERAAHYAHVGREKAHIARVKTEDAYGTNPLLFGAGALALGFGLAMMLPKTTREAELLGPRRDRVLERAKQAAVEAKDRAFDAAKQGMER